MFHTDVMDLDRETTYADVKLLRNISKKNNKLEFWSVITKQQQIRSICCAQELAHIHRNPLF